MANLLNFRAAIGVVAALIASVATSGCGFGLDGKYPPSRYEGVWRIQLTSDACGSSDAETTSVADWFAFSAYDDKYYFTFEVSDAAVQTPHRGNWAFRDATTNEITSYRELPKLSLDFPTLNRAKGSWNSKKCTGKIILQKLK